MSERDYRKELTEKIIQEMKKGTAPWQVPWDESKRVPRPMNAVNRRRYNGINSLHLEMISRERGYADPRWCTYKQALDQGWHVKKGEKGTFIEFWKFKEFRELKDANGKPVLDSEGNVKKDEIELEKPLCRYYTLFNGQQIAGIPEMEKEKVDWPAEQRADNILRESGAKIFHDQDKSAYYQPAKDEIHMPPKSHFQNSDRYYATSLHELGHWTGHETRLNRHLQTRDKAEYAKEELRAELASYFMSDRLKISNEIENHASYLQSWIKVLKEDKHEIFRASRDAEKITEYVMAYEKEMKCTLSIVDKQNFKTFQITLAVKRDELDLSNPDALRGFLNQEKEKYLKNLNLNPDKCQFQLKPLEMSRVKSLSGLDR